MCTLLRELLAGKECLGLPAGGVGAQRTAEGQLARTNHVGLQVGLDQVCQSLDRNTGVIPALLQQQSVLITAADEAPGFTIVFTHALGIPGIQP